MTVSHSGGNRTGPESGPASGRYGLNRRHFNRLALAVCLSVTIGAAGYGPAAPAQTPTQAPAASTETAPTQPKATALTIITLGDSLSAGYGLARDAAFTSQLETALRARGYAVTVPNTGVSGETTTGGLSRLDWLLSDRPDLMIVQLGANDGLRGIDPAVTRANLDRILSTLKQRRIPALLVGMLAPPNLGRDYGAVFNALYPELAAKHGVPLYPFFLDGVAMKRELNLEDGMHPTAAGVAIMVDRILPLVMTTLDGLKSRPSPSTGPG